MTDNQKAERPALTPDSTLADVMRAFPDMPRWQAVEQLHLIRGTFEDDKQPAEDDT